MKDNSFEKIRRDYEKHALAQSDLNPNPYKQLKDWLQAAVEADCSDATAMTLATVDTQQHPDVRIVLLKKCDEQSITFFTDFDSAKGEQLKHNPFVAINFYWSALERQVRIKGNIACVPDKESDEYFALRPRESQLAASVSKQSRVIESREVLEKEYERIKAQYENKSIPRPAHWGGYQVAAHYFEFWQGRINRLHDRFAYKQTKEGWKISRLSP